MAKLAIPNEKTSASAMNLGHLPLKEYVDSIADKVERYKVKEALKCACRITSDTQLWRILAGRTSPDQFQREAIAEYVRWYSGSEVFTAETLFKIS
ncbi:MAG: hypothetical protein J6U95_03815 [Alistipes sp.]|nr:hypothetical protein [Alistipes sp.]